MSDGGKRETGVDAPRQFLAAMPISIGMPIKAESKASFTPREAG
jgi:hypothetical protein